MKPRKFLHPIFLNYFQKESILEMFLHDNWHYLTKKNWFRNLTKKQQTNKRTKKQASKQKFNLWFLRSLKCFKTLSNDRNRTDFVHSSKKLYDLSHGQIYNIIDTMQNDSLFGLQVSRRSFRNMCNSVNFTTCK